MSSALSQITEAITTARSLGAQHIQFTVSRDMAAELKLEIDKGPVGEFKRNDKPKPGKPGKRPSRRKLRDAQRDAEGSVMTIDGCPIFIGDGDGMSYSWRK